VVEHAENDLAAPSVLDQVGRALGDGNRHLSRIGLVEAHTSGEHLRQPPGLSGLAGIRDA